MGRIKKNSIGMPKAEKKTVKLEENAEMMPDIEKEAAAARSPGGGGVLAVLSKLEAAESMQPKMEAHARGFERVALAVYAKSCESMQPVI